MSTTDELEPGMSEQQKLRALAEAIDEGEEVRKYIAEYGDGVLGGAAPEVTWISASACPGYFLTRQMVGRSLQRHMGVIFLEILQINEERVRQARKALQEGE